MKIEDRGGHLYNRGLLKLCASSLLIFAGTAAGWGAGAEEVSKSAYRVHRHQRGVPAPPF